MLDADGQADEVGRHPGGKLLLIGQLLVRRRRRVDGQGLGVPDIGQVRDEREGVDELLSRLGAALYPETDDGAGAPGRYFSTRARSGLIREPGIIHPGDLFMARKVLGHRQRIFGVARHPQVDRLQAHAGRETS